MSENQDKIKVLDHRGQAREKLPIFYGSRDNYTHGIKELIANAADELKNNAAEGEEPVVEVTLSNYNTMITVSDNGRGIPIDGETDGVPNYVLLFETLFAGTKYDINDGVTTGTNGVGTTVLNYTSKNFNVHSFYNGKQHILNYINGGFLDYDLKTLKLDKDNKDKHGSTFSAILDNEVYTETVFKPNEVENIVKHFAVAAKGIKFIFNLELENGEINTTEFKYDTHREYFDEVIGSQSTSAIFTLGRVELEENISETKSDKFSSDTVSYTEKNSYEIYITTTPTQIQETYLNMTFLEEGGEILEGTLDGVRLWLNKYCRDNKLFPKNVTTFSKDDISSSISLLGIVESNNVEFANQTKLSTNKKTYGKQAKEYITNLLDAMLNQDAKNVKKLVKHVLEVQKFNGANEKAREKLKKKLTEKVEGIGNKVLKLIDCAEHGMDAELYITEGDSANGSIIDARDDEFQAAYPLRGKMLNTLKASLDETFKNQEIVDLVKIIGTGITDAKKGNDEFDIRKARYGKIIITTDADPDGGHIAVLILTFIYRYMQPLLEHGMVYVARTPLYELKFSDDSVIYFNSEDEKNKMIGKYEGQKYVMNRLKGLGEVDAHIMHETAMNPKTRNLYQLTIEDGKKYDKMLTDWMDDDVLPRKELITNQLPQYIDLSE